MRVVINDANILIDLVKIDLMNQFVQLDMELKTTDFVFEELNEEQKNILKQYIEARKIEIITTEKVEDFAGIASILDNSSGLSFEDCSVWYYANKLNGMLLSGDGRLRRLASENGIEVRGILFVFDQLLLKGLITFELAIEKIELLYKINSRLPIHSKNERISHWILNKHVN